MNQTNPLQHGRQIRQSQTSCFFLVLLLFTIFTVQITEWHQFSGLALAKKGNKIPKMSNYSFKRKVRGH